MDDYGDNHIRQITPFETKRKVAWGVFKARVFKAAVLIFQLKDGDGVRIVHDGACHRLIIDCCSNDDGAVYRFEAEGRKSEATLRVEGKDVTLTCDAVPPSLRATRC